MDLSILIPNFKRNITNLVEELVRQAGEVLHDYEIIVADDGSDSDTIDTYQSLENHDAVKIIFQQRNLGRAETRNNLVSNARYDAVLFIDSDALVTSHRFLKDYAEHSERADVLVGGIQYQDAPPEPPCMLRWTIGRTREQVPARERNKRPYAAFSAFNFMARKSIFDTVHFRQDLRKYGHEDTLFGMALGQHGFSIYHIDNPLLHNGLESNQAFLDKTIEALESLAILDRDPDMGIPVKQHVKLLRVYHRLDKWHLSGMLYAFHRSFEERIRRNLRGPHPSLWYFQWYKLAHFHQLRKSHGEKYIRIPDSPK